MNDRRAAIMRQIQDLQSQLAQMEKLPANDEYPDGTVIRVKARRGDNKMYTYVLLKVSVPVTGVSYIGTPPVESWWYFTGTLFAGTPEPRKVRRTTWRHVYEAFTAYGVEVMSWQVMMPMDPPTPVTVVLNDDHPAGRYTADPTLPGNEPFRLYVEDGEFVVR